MHVVFVRPLLLTPVYVGKHFLSTLEHEKGIVMRRVVAQQESERLSKKSNVCTECV